MQDDFILQEVFIISNSFTLSAVSPEQKLQASQNFIHRKIAGNDVLISIGSNITNFNGYIEPNPSALLLWERLKTPCRIDDLADCLVQEYRLSDSDAKTDATEFVSLLLEHQMLEVLP